MDRTYRISDLVALGPFKRAKLFKEIKEGRLRAHKAGFATVMAFCEAPRCGHSAAVDLAGLPPDLPIPDIALRLRCFACGRQEIKIHINVHELYAMAWGGEGYQGIAAVRVTGR